MFKKRAKEQGAIYIAGNTSTIILDPLKDIANSVKTVVLHIDDGEAVLVNNIQHLGNSKFRGTIYGFEPSYELIYKTLSLGGTVNFDESEVFSLN